MPPKRFHSNNNKKNDSRNHHSQKRPMKKHKPEDDELTVEQKRSFLKSIETSSDDDNNSDNNDSSQHHHQARQSRMNTSSRREQQIRQQQTTTTASSSSSSDEDENNHNNNNTNSSAIIQQDRRIFSQEDQQYLQSIEYRAGTVYDCFGQKFHHFSELPQVLGTRIASSLLSDRNKKPSFKSIQKYTQQLLNDVSSSHHHDSTKTTSNNKKTTSFQVVFLLDRKTGERVELENVRAKGAYLFEIKESENLIRFFQQQQQQQSKNTIFDNRTHRSDEKVQISTVGESSLIMTKKMMDQVDIINNDDNADQLTTTTSFHHHLLQSDLQQYFPLLASKSSLKFQSLDFPVLPTHHYYHHNSSQQEQEQEYHQQQHLYHKLLDKPGPQCYSVASVFWQAPPVLIERNPSFNNSNNNANNNNNNTFSSTSRKVISFSGGPVVECASFPPLEDVGPLFLSASLPDELLILSSRFEAERLYRLYKVPSSLHRAYNNNNDSDRAVQGDRAVFRRNFDQGITEPIQSFSVANSIYLVARRSVRSRRGHQQNGVFRTASDILCSAPASLNVEDDSGILIGLRDGTFGLFHHNNGTTLSIISKLDEPIIGVGCTDLMSSSSNNNNHFFTVTASQKVLIWDSNNNNNNNRAVKEKNKNTDRNRTSFDFLLHNNSNNSPLLVLNRGENWNINHGADADHEDIVQPSGSFTTTRTNQQQQRKLPSTTLLSGIPLFSFVAGGHCYFEYEFNNDALALKRLNFRRQQQHQNDFQQQRDHEFVETVARWEHLSQERKKDSSDEQSGELSSLSSSFVSRSQRLEHFRKRQDFSRFHTRQAFFGAVSAGQDYETKRPCCFVVDEVHQFAVGVSL